MSACPVGLALADHKIVRVRRAAAVIGMFDELKHEVLRMANKWEKEGEHHLNGGEAEKEVAHVTHRPLGIRRKTLPFPCVLDGDNCAQDCHNFCVGGDNGCVG